MNNLADAYKTSFMGKRDKPLKVVSATFLLVCLVSLKESTFETRKNVFLFHFKSSFPS